MSDSEKHLVILVEDEEILSNLLSQKLTNAGYEVVIASDGEEGLTAITGKKPALVLLDMMLPKLNGFGVLERLHEQGILPDLPVVVISNSGQPVEIERAQKLGIRDYLVKLNFDPDEVLEKVKTILPPGAPAPTQAPKQEEQTQDAPEKQAPAEPTQTNILVVEDDMFIADLLVRKLHERYKVHHASDTSLAAKILEENDNIEIICLDIILPGEDGYTFLGKLKRNEATKDIPVLILSNLGQKEEIERGLAGGAAGYLIKANMSPDEILEHVDKLLREKLIKENTPQEGAAEGGAPAAAAPVAPPETTA